MFLVPKKHAYEPLFRAFIRLSRLFFINLQSFLVHVCCRKLRGNVMQYDLQR